MRTMINVTMEIDAGNNAIKDGVLQKLIKGFTEKYHPESMYFYPKNGHRGMTAVVDIKDSSTIPAIAEPFFLNLNAEVEFIPVMNADDLMVGLPKSSKHF